MAPSQAPFPTHIFRAFSIHKEAGPHLGHLVVLLWTMSLREGHTSVACRLSTPQCGGSNWQQCSESVAVIDLKWYSQFNSLLNMLRTIFICAILAAGVFVFNRDASRLVLEPIARMLKKVKDVSENPLAVKQVRAGWSPEFPSTVEPPLQASLDHESCMACRV